MFPFAIRSTHGPISGLERGDVGGSVSGSADGSGQGRFDGRVLLGVIQLASLV